MTKTTSKICFKAKLLRPAESEKARLLDFSDAAKERQRLGPLIWLECVEQPFAIARETTLAQVPERVADARP